MGDENSLQSGTVAHKHSLPSSDGGELSIPDTMIGNMPLTAWSVALS